jgi:MFS transporter, SP family, arabinose:H+ symporter
MTSHIAKSSDGETPMSASPASASEATHPAVRENVNMAFVLLLSVIGALGGLMFGFDIAIITGAGPFIEKAFDLDHLELGFAFSSLLFGCTVGAALAGVLADRIGRRLLMIVVTCIGTGMATDFVTFNVMRFVGGIAVGAVSLVAPMYVAEVAPASLRGRMGALYQMAIVTGILLSYLVNYLLADTGPDAWRLMFYSGALPAALYFVLMLIAPETPRFLVMRGDPDAALALSTHIVGPAAARVEMQAIVASLAVGKPALRDFGAPAVRIPMLIGLGLGILIHFSGINTVIEYSPMIFKSAGFTLDAALLSTFVIGIANFLFTLISFWVIDRVGRRPLYIFGSIGMAVTLFCLVAAVLLGHFHGPAVLALMVIYLMFFASCIGPVFWTLLPEILPNHVRSSALIVPVVGQWLANAVAVLLFPLLLMRLGQAGAFALLGGFCVAQALFAYVLVPETKGQSLEDIGRNWR